ncbi:hypothetical protein [Streptacidiphilus sp. PAMC 29251]
MPEPRWSRISPADLFPAFPAPPALASPALAPAAAPEFSDRGRHASPSPDEPVYSQLVREWQLRGLMLPGQRDREWVELVVRQSWR